MAMIQRSGFTGVGQRKNEKYIVEDIQEIVSVINEGSGGGLEGSSYVFVAANGTPEENAAELQAAYDLAETKVATATVVTPLTLFYMSPTFNVNSSMGATTVYLNYGYTFPYAAGQSYDWVIDGVTYSGYLVSVMGINLSINFVGVPNGTYNNLAIVTQTGLPATVIAAPGLYDFDTDFIVDKPYINVVSLDGERSVIFNGSGSIQVLQDNITVKGIDVQDKIFRVKYNLLYTIIDNCKGGDYSFSDLSSVGLACFLKNCEGGDYSFGYYGNITGTLTNCKGGDYSFGTSLTYNYQENTGLFIECEAGQRSFSFWNYYMANPVYASGRYVRCKGTSQSFGMGYNNGGMSNMQGFMTYCELLQLNITTVGNGIIMYTYNNYYGNVSPINIGFTTQSQL